jgi:4'-phosphopantetheinyl transferase
MTLSGCTGRVCTEPVTGRVRVWWADRREARPELVRLLNSVERHRRAAYVNGADADRFLLGVAITRLVAAQETGLPPVAIELDRRCPHCGGPHGRVLLPGTDITVSVAHSGDIVGVAFGRSARVGLDVEELTTRIHHAGLADLVLTPPEVAELARLPDSRAGLLRYWVRKEALLKLTGDGLAGRPDAITVSAPDEPAALLSWTDRPEFVGTVRLHDLVARAGHLAAVAVSTRLLNVVEADATALLRAAAP